MIMHGIGTDGTQLSTNVSAASESAVQRPLTPLEAKHASSIELRHMHSTFVSIHCLLQVHCGMLHRNAATETMRSMTFPVLTV